MWLLCQLSLMCHPLLVQHLVPLHLQKPVLHHTSLVTRQHQVLLACTLHRMSALRLWTDMRCLTVTRAAIHTYTLSFPLTHLHHSPLSRNQPHPQTLSQIHSPPPPVSTPETTVPAAHSTLPTPHSLNHQQVAPTPTPGHK
ncbi:hypothetical protein BJ878DRAFT_267626 [Calycina marina]|uniref:Uncharacterized protein n=1 Tax=Calycina marina TaxID=1763456 RepID=A0A9P7Z792_9HELO|nr:hypothetical protein BJ878DRAFT_267626 [Calycina marina]